MNWNNITSERAIHSNNVVVSQALMFQSPTYFREHRQNDATIHTTSSQLDVLARWMSMSLFSSSFDSLDRMENCAFNILCFNPLEMP